MKHILLALLLSFPALAQTITFPISNGKLTSALDANSHDINKILHLTIGAGTATHAIEIYPNGTPTDAASGIAFGGDTILYRSATGSLTLSGNLVVTGSITGAGSPITLSGTNAWTGTNTFAGSSTFSGAITIGTAGLSFSGSGVTNTRTAMGLRPGTDIQAYSALLAGIVTAGTPGSGSILVGNGSAYALQSGDTARTSLGLGTASAPTFAGLTLSGSLSGTSATLSGILTVSGATAQGSALTIGGARVWGNGAVLTSDSAILFSDNVQLGSASNNTVTVYGSVLFGSAQDTNLYRSAANTLKTDDAFIAASLQPVAALSTAYGGTGADLSATVAGKFLYTASTGTFATSDITSTSRTLLALSSTAAWIGSGGLNLGTAAVLNVPASGDAASGEVVKGTDTRLTDGRVPSGAAGGDLSGTYPNPVLTASGVTAAVYGSAGQIPVLTLDAKGRVTGASSTTISLTGVPAGGHLTGTYPNPTIAAGAVLLGTATTGNYASGITAGSSISLTGVTGVGTAFTIDTIQDIRTTASPTFTNLTLSGTLSVSSLSPASLTLTTNSLTGLQTSNRVFVDPDHAFATNTRTSLDRHDPNRPFLTLAAAVTAAVSGETVVLRRTTGGSYPSQALKNGVDLYLEDGVTLTQVTATTAVTSTIQGHGTINNLAGAGVLVTDVGAAVTLDCIVKGSTNGLSISNGLVVLKGSARLESSSGSNPALLISGGEVDCYDSTSIVNISSGPGINGSGSHNVVSHGMTSVGGGVTGTTLNYSGGAFNIDGDLYFNKGRAVGATSAGNQFQIGTATGLYEDGAGTLRANGPLKANSLTLTATPLAVTSGGTGAATVSAALTSLGLDARGLGKMQTGTLDGGTTTLTIGTDIDNDTVLILVNCISEDRILYLPNGAGFVNGRRYVIRNIGTIPVKVDTQGVNTFADSGLTYTWLSPYPAAALEVVADASNTRWFMTLHRPPGILKQVTDTMTGSDTHFIGFGSTYQVNGDAEVILVASSGSSNVLQLPGVALEGAVEGRTIRVINKGTTAFSLAATNSFTFGASANSTAGSSTVTMDPGDSSILTCDVANGRWNLVSSTPVKATTVLAASGGDSLVITPSHTYFTVTPSANEALTVNTTDGVVGSLYTLKIVDTGVARTITFGTNFKTSAGTLVTAGTSKIYVLLFVFDGTSLLEISRTSGL